MPENALIGFRNRLLQELAMRTPGGMSLRVRLHRWRGVEIGRNVWIGYEAMLENAYPHLIHIGNNVVISMRATILAHFLEQRGVWIEDDVFIGACACILPSVRLGKGCVVTAGSVVTTTVPSFTVVQGNPARPVARNGISLVGQDKELKSFLSQLTPIR